MLRFASLGSGSDGNGLVVQSLTHAVDTIDSSTAANHTTVLMDCGFGLADTEKRLAKLGLQAQDLTGILVTHEHSDHIAGVYRLAKKYQIPVWCTRGTHTAAARLWQKEGVHLVDWRLVRSEQAFVIAGLTITPYTVPHDAVEPVQFVFHAKDQKLGVLTDVGQVTQLMIQQLAGCQSLVLEFNHDSEMLANSKYPQSLKRRISGAYGHLDNHTAGRLLKAIIDHAHTNNLPKPQQMVAAHLSKQNNHPDLVWHQLTEIGHPMECHIACQEEGFDWRIAA